MLTADELSGVNVVNIRHIYTYLLAVFTKDQCFRNFPKGSERFGKFRNHSVDFIILHWISDQKYHITEEKYLKWHYRTETIFKNYIIERPIAETIRIFWNVSERFGNNNPL